MSDRNSEMRLRPTEAAEKLIGLYPAITASDPEIYAAGLVHIFSRYPEHLVAAALDPATGLPSLHDFPPTMKQVRDYLEPRWQDLCRTNERIERFNRKRLPEPPANPDADRRIREGLEKLSFDLKRGIGP